MRATEEMPGVNFLLLILGPKLRLRLLSQEPGQEIATADGCLFIQQRQDEEAVFYDWLADEASVIQGIEIHLAPDHPSLRATPPLTSLEYVTLGPFVRIWFARTRDGMPLGKEAFGDLFFFRDKNNTLAILVGISEWLSRKEQDSLLKNLQLGT